MVEKKAVVNPVVNILIKEYTQNLLVEGLLTS
jgi:hypothetical protein